MPARAFHGGRKPTHKICHGSELHRSQGYHTLSNMPFNFCLFVGFFCLLAVSRTTTAYEYKIGVGKNDITDGAENIGLQGWADSDQKTKSSQKHRIYARAFLVRSTSNQGARICMVVTDNWAATDLVKRTLLWRLNNAQSQSPAKSFCNRNNFMLMASHAHSAPGGYSDFKLYEHTVGGRDLHNLENIVQGTVNAIESAHSNMTDGDIFFSVENITKPAGGNIDPEVAGQRSEKAFDNNPDVGALPAKVDYRMFLLKFTQGNTPVGMLNWYSLHPTSLGQYYKRTAGDSKGYAATVFEEKNPGVIAAFANSHAGDVSGNIPYKNNLRSDDDGYEARMKKSGMYQYNASQTIYDSASTKLQGSIKFRWQRQDMSNYTIDSSRKTCTGALGLSFTAGSKEDGFAVPDVSINEGKRYSSDLNDNAGNMGGLTTKAKAAMVANALSLTFKTKETSVKKDKASCQYPKPVVATTGEVGATPDVLPFQMFKIGQLAIAACPGELTSMAGWRIMKDCKNSLSSIGVTSCAIAGYANEYSQYVTTLEEYHMQHYEGASTLFGPHTLGAYRKIFKDIAKSIVDGVGIDSGPSRSGTTAPNNKRITIRNKCRSKAKIEIFDKGDLLADVEKCGWNCSGPGYLCKISEFTSNIWSWVCKVVQQAAVPRINSPSEVAAGSDKVYWNVLELFDNVYVEFIDLVPIKIRLDNEEMIGSENSPIKNGDLVILEEDNNGECREGYVTRYDTEPFWQAFP